MTTLNVAAGSGSSSCRVGWVALWLAGFAGLLLLGVAPSRYATGSALRVFAGRFAR